MTEKKTVHSESNGNNSAGNTKTKKEPSKHTRSDNAGAADTDATEQLYADYGDLKKGARVTHEERLNDGRSCTNDRQVAKSGVLRNLPDREYLKATEQTKDN